MSHLQEKYDIKRETGSPDNVITHSCTRGIKRRWNRSIIANTVKPSESEHPGDQQKCSLFRDVHFS